MAPSARAPLAKKPRDRRAWYQAAFALGLNAWIPSWFKGGIFQGPVKGVCVPGLNCYSCPSALGACPIGSLQTALGGLRFNLSVAEKKFGLYVAGFLAAVGSAVGRMPCGWVCPFGFLQELLHRIRTPKLRVPRTLTYVRYLVLAVTVVALPLLVVDQFGYGQTWFCKWICPAGTLEAGIPLMLIKADLRPLIGFMYHWKLALLGLFLAWFVFSRRPFCRTVCPLGAIWGLFNRASLFRMAVDDEKCTLCDKCYRDCPVQIRIYERANSPDCVRCLKCVSSCKFGAVSYEFLGKKEVAVDLRVKKPA
ncbi:MAG TPA: 4Fe-4S binding protein [Candidatus Aminicenantes bacterium]|nr:4Fe-4S binding protein [Candidatus Aminicenantes bacterium]